MRTVKKKNQDLNRFFLHSEQVPCMPYSRGHRRGENRLSDGNIKHEKCVASAVCLALSTYAFLISPHTPRGSSKVSAMTVPIMQVR